MAIKMATPASAIPSPNPFDEHLSSEPIKANSTMTKKAGKADETLVKESAETLHPGVLIAPDQLYLLTVEGGTTINLGNYESARVGISLRVPTTKDDLDASHDWAVEWIGKKINAMVAEAKGV